MGQFELKSSQFRAEREAGWQELETLIDKIEKQGIRELDADEISRLPTLYRSAVSSLSVARAISLDRNLLDYLESLVGRAYIAVYSTKRPAGDAILRFLTYSFPVAVRRHWKHLAAAVTIMFLGTACGFALTLSDSERYYSLVSAEMAQGRTPAATTESLREVLYYGADEDEETDADEKEKRGRGSAALHVFATFLFTHNAKIAIMCFALGFAACAPAVFLLFYNGLVLGAMGALYHSRGLGAEFAAWIWPHGVTELGAVCLCGMAGIALGMAVIFPGEHTRLDNLARRGREVAMAVIGAVLMLFIAALIEGFFRQLVHDQLARWSLAGATLILWVAYFTLVGRGRERDDRA